jgi:long-chain acyl-CoA synthetase
MDEEGYFYVVDRKKDMIKYKGYSVFSREVEEVLYQHPCVKEAAVIGVPHPEADEIPKAFIVLKDECNRRHHQVNRGQASPLREAARS